MAVAYSYIRFSSAKQAGGDSLRRQTDLARAYARDHGLELADLSYQDLGVSGFDRSNIERGALSLFLKAVGDGKIDQGSFLLVEQFDRLSRAEIPDALRLLLNLVSAGIVVVTLLDQRVWDKESINDVANILTSIISMHRAHEESALKSKRLRSVWSQKKAHASTSIVTSECPRWLQISNDKQSFLICEDRVGSIQKIFEMRIKGFGIASIASHANKCKWPVPGNGNSWHTSLVGRILKNRALLGEYQPFTYKDGERVPVGDPVMGYYPPVIDQDTFNRAHAVTNRRADFPNRRDANYRNFLQGILYCKCGKRFCRKNKTSKKSPGYARYYCSARVRGLTSCPSASAMEIEGAILNAVANLAPQYVTSEDAIHIKRNEVELLEIELRANSQRVERFAEAVAESSASLPSLLQKLSEAEQGVSNSNARLSILRSELADLQVRDSEEVLLRLIAIVSDSDSVEARSELRENLVRILDRIIIYPDERFLQMHFKNSSIPVNIPLGLDALIPGLEFYGSANEEQAFAVQSDAKSKIKHKSSK